MKMLLIPVIVVLVIMVVSSLVRGIAAFLRSTREDLEHTGTGATPSQLMQNKMMFSRIKYQAAAVLVVALLMAIAR